eukprot:scaffold5120_cov40-Prasinocladus_malaysianus.AAC.1
MEWRATTNYDRRYRIVLFRFCMRLSDSFTWQPLLIILSRHPTTDSCLAIVATAKIVDYDMNVRDPANFGSLLWI